MIEKLSPKFWSPDGNIKSDVRKNLLQIAKDFISFTKVKNFKILDIIFTGSLANYTYHNKSDIDLHVVFDLSKFEKHRKFIKEYLQSKKTIWNNNHNVNIHGFEVEIYPETEKDQRLSSGVFSLMKNSWLKKPEKPKGVKIDKDLVKRKYNDKVAQILYFENQTDKKDVDYKRLLVDIRKFVLDVQASRKSGLASAGEFAPENLVFKMLRNNGYFEKLRDMKNRIYDTHLSLERSR